MDHRQTRDADELVESIQHGPHAVRGSHVVAGTPQVGRVEAERQPIRSRRRADALEDGRQLLEPRPSRSPPPDEFSRSSRTDGGLGQDRAHVLHDPAQTGLAADAAVGADVGVHQRRPEGGRALHLDDQPVPRLRGERLSRAGQVDEV